MELILFFLPIILMFAAQKYITSTYKKHSTESVSTGKSGYEAARIMLDQNNLSNVKILQVQGELTDHFDPRTNTVSLSKSVYNDASIASVAIAAHECGHAIQHQENYIPIKIRQVMVPVVNISSKIGFAMIFIGLFAQLLNIAFIGLILMSAGLLFQLVTLPVEFNASRRAKAFLYEKNIVTEIEKTKVNSMLNAAAMTYLASFFATIMSMLRLLLIINRRR